MLNSVAQIGYLIQWFQEWSELQKADFLPIMAEKYANRVYVNGIVNSISNVECRDKPMSLFECRVKLFKEWFSQWSIEQKEQFFKQITDLDPIFAEKLSIELQSATGNISNDSGNGNEEILED
ncbi:hypothetical protein WA026_011829 [Henosepilachna vigintioctopunctata]|uniref:Uncharacterized protein n=1 Tax=Henosepilachna vigintioctopunctata TaxID=420089 RepID=A0AAW1UMF4_9CUCU